jgi:hypothetical protein
VLTAHKRSQTRKNRREGSRVFCSPFLVDQVQNPPVQNQTGLPARRDFPIEGQKNTPEEKANPFASFGLVLLPTVRKRQKCRIDRIALPYPLGLNEHKEDSVMQIVRVPEARRLECVILYHKVEIIFPSKLKFFFHFLPCLDF